MVQSGFALVGGFALLAAAAPAPQVPGYKNADAPYESFSYPNTPIPSSFGPDSQIPATETTFAKSGSLAAPPVISSVVTGVTSHGPYSGTPTTTGAVTASTTLGTTISPLPPNPTATYYNANGELQDPEPIPYQPNGKSIPPSSMIRRLTIS
jgi:hypothetical protein